MANILVQFTESTSKLEAQGNIDDRMINFFIDGVTEGFVYRKEDDTFMNFSSDEHMADSSNDFASNIGISWSGTATDVNGAIEELKTSIRGGGEGGNTAFFDIGDWDMDTTGTAAVTLTGVDPDYIRGAQIFIINDDGDLLTPIYIDTTFTAADGHFSIDTSVDPAVLNMGRKLGGFFDSTSYDSTSYNRGYIIVDYMV